MTGRRRTEIAIVVVFAVLAIALGAFAVWKSSGRNQIVVLGDSITNQARDPIAARLRIDDDRIQAVAGKTIDDMMPAAEELATSHPKQVIINLGTNDVLLGEPVDPNVDALLKMAGLYPDATCVHLVTINEVMISPNGSDIHKVAVGLNQKMHEWAAAAPGRRVVEWAKIITDYDAAGKPAGPSTYDTVHPTYLGQDMLIDALQASVDSCR